MPREGPGKEGIARAALSPTDGGKPALRSCAHDTIFWLAAKSAEALASIAIGLWLSGFLLFVITATAMFLIDAKAHAQRLIRAWMALGVIACLFASMALLPAAQWLVTSY